ncbi:MULTISPECIES: helix-turn-helix domain-containing protein [Chromobacterium]|uniref:helix-turn-helix domain-containing protein n=1 Tax=Chromobacterium TaxID=535 RepID=UPI0018C89CB9|nr:MULTISPECIES: helix-turn-helix domain-containing protein [Chromobacterium]WON83253.1 helix-turn-helix domain-containing protein [Chromobacterium haemolyticum]
MKETLNLDEAAGLMNIGTETARELADKGALPGCKVGVAWVFLRDDVLGYLRDEVRRQTNERIARAEAIKLISNGTQPRVKTAAKAAGTSNNHRRHRPDLDALENAT